MKTKKSETKTAAPKATREYDLIMYSDCGDMLEEVCVTRTEHKALKEHLASIRKSKPARFEGCGDSSADGLFELPRVGAQEFDWLKTPWDSGYKLEIWATDDRGALDYCVKEIHITRQEYIALKQHLASMRAKPQRGKAAA
jgi:hypothetical protein